MVIKTNKWHCHILFLCLFVTSLCIMIVTYRPNMFSKLGIYQSAMQEVSNVFALKPEPQKDKWDRIDILQRENENIPYKILFRINTENGTFQNLEDRGTNNTCPYIIPNFLHLEVSSYYWQVLTLPRATLFLYSAILDSRISTEDPIIRVIFALKPLNGYRNVSGLENFQELDFGLMCNLWYLDDYLQPERVVSVNAAAIPFRMWRGNDGKALDEYFYFGGTVECRIPDMHNDTLKSRMPTFLSVATRTEKCSRPTNALIITYPPVKQYETNSVALCVQPMLYPNDDISLKMVEWFEILQQQEYSKVIMYVIDVHPNIEKVLKHYSKLGFLDVVPFSFPERLHRSSLSLQLYRDMMTSVEYRPLQHPGRRDCFYRNMHSYDYIAQTDMDEIIVPAKAGSIPDLLQEVNPKRRFDSLMFHRWYFPESQQNTTERLCSAHEESGYSHSLYMTFNSYSMGKCKVNNGKSIHRTDRVVHFNAHFATNSLNETKSTVKIVKADIAKTRHYRKTCDNIITAEDGTPYTDPKLTFEPSIRQYFETQDRVAETLRKIFG